MKVRIYQKDKNYGGMPKDLSLADLCFCQKIYRFLPNLYAYYDRAKGCYIWGLEGKKYLDMSNMGVGTNVLGYSNKKIDNKVTSNIKKSNFDNFIMP